MTADGNRTDDLINAIGTSLGEPTVAVVGCGGAGSNIVHGIYWKSNRVETVAVNTDEDRLRNIDAHRKVLIGKDVTFGSDSGGFPEVGEHCGEKAKEVLKEALRGYDIVFVVAGMGGGTGTGVAPIVAGVAKEMNAIAFAVPILPFDTEGAERKRIALDGASKLKEASDFTIVLDNNRLMTVGADLPMSDALKVVDRSVMRIVDAICDHTSSYVNNLMEDITGVAESVGEPTPGQHSEVPDTQMIHADLDPMFNGFGPSMFG